MTTVGVVALAVTFVAGTLISPRLRAQTSTSAQDLPDFDVASIKVNKSGDLRVVALRQPGGRFTATNATLQNLIADAYHLIMTQQGFRISGGPSWMDSEHFDIEARAEGNPTGEQQRLMLQSFLADRFKLMMHHETRQLPVYALVLAKAGKTGPQLLRHTDDTKCLSPGAPPRQPSTGAALPVPPCGAFLAVPRSGSVTLVGNLTMEKFAQVLMVDRVVVDRTGLNGIFDLTLEYTPDVAPPNSSPGANVSVPGLSAPPSLFTALQEQLGLKLESQKGPVDVLVNRSRGTAFGELTEVLH